MPQNTTCDMCERGVFLTTSMCRYHYYETYGLDQPFGGLKERYFVERVRQHLLAQRIRGVVINRRLPGSFIRPDLYFYILDSLFLVEVDEGQHRNYDSKAERRRLHEVAEEGLRAVYVLRINPDAYKGGPAIWKKRLVIRKIGEKEQVLIETNEQERERRWWVVRCKLDHLISLAMHGPLKVYEEPEGRVPIWVTYLFYD